MRKSLIIANWKMHKNGDQTREYLSRLLELLGTDFQEREVVICPPFTSLSQAEQQIAGTGMKLGGQNMFWEEQGSFTGEISPLMLRDCHCSYVILGHSERRSIWRENDQIINRKIKAAMRNDLTPVFCLGETWQERQQGRTREVLYDQLVQGLHQTRELIQDLVLAYEPVWAIGSGNNAQPSDARAVAEFLRHRLGEIYPHHQADQIRILYGGSVTRENIRSFMGQHDVDGVLVGGASLEADHFAEIVRYDQ